MKAKYWVIFVIIIFLSFFIGSAVKQLTTPHKLSTNEMTEQIERVYNANVHSLIEKSSLFVASFDKDGAIYEVQMNPITGQFSNLQLIHKNETQQTDDQTTSEQNNETKTQITESTENSIQVLLSEQQAIEIAIKEIPGKIDSVDYEKTTDGGNYFIEIEQGEQEIIVQIHAITGKILSIQYDD